MRKMESVRDYYGRWAATYGDPSDDGWFARVRQREHRIVHELLALTGGETILDVGCGAGGYARPLAERGHEVWAIDLAPEMVARVADHVHHASVGDVETLALGRTFDRVLCLGVLEFVDPDVTLARLAQHLAPNGLAVLLAPRRTLAGRIYQLTKLRHGLRARLYTRRELRARGNAHGLVEVEYRQPAAHNLAIAFRAP